MIIRENKTYESISHSPNTNPYPNDDSVLYIVDETKEDGKLLCEEIWRLYPNYDFGEVDGEFLLSVTEILSDDPRYINPNPITE